MNDTSSFTLQQASYQCAPAQVCAAGSSFYQAGGNYEIISASTYATLSNCGGSVAATVGCASAVASNILDISPQPDHSSLLAVGGNLYSVIQFESPSPAVMYMVGLTLSTSGDLSVKPGTLKPINWAPYGGLLSPCAGSTTPWQSHLGSEESTGIDARDFAAFFYQTVPYAKSLSLSTFASSGFMRYWGVYPSTLTNATVLANYDPYMYGFPTEVKITPGVGAGYTAVKHMAMGRTPWEMSLVMPDNRTVYSGPDAGNGGFYKYIANTPGDLSSGSLYCAAYTQTSPVNSVGGTFTISWILMSNTTDAFVLNAVNGTANGVSAALTFDDIFVTDLPTSATSGACNSGFTSVNAGYGSYTANGVSYPNECLKLNPATPNAAILAATLETGRYAGMLGCTTEFNKWEGAFGLAAPLLCASGLLSLHITDTCFACPCRYDRQRAPQAAVRRHVVLERHQRHGQHDDRGWRAQHGRHRRLAGHQRGGCALRLRVLPADGQHLERQQHGAAGVRHVAVGRHQRQHVRREQHRQPRQHQHHGGL